ncbi:MBL fold metallo-hydrolase [Paenibacillus sp. OAS669]|uniref:MBL fold metallo-hydrolase n=1 Tax=Paenibacillus sp. OAS669 TaxID=2663821 RepID=UPI00178BA8A2|nr:MBL fold metallo-hydrolase [Paenibacillus sp. OAS669]MBE1441834.1 ribonuclease BN (tRNA processing enzyme) [Paenibacillus sp. OAS669]
MRLTVLGPWGAYPAAGEASAGYLVEHQGHQLLLDCGSGVLSVVQKHTRLQDLSAAIISHRHHDHIADLGCLQYACLIDSDLRRREVPLPIYIASDGLSTNEPYRSMKGSEIRSVSEHDVLHLHGMECSFFKTFHEVYCLGIKIKAGGKTIVYTADSCFDESLISFCQGADLLIAETSFYAEFQNARQYGHMNTTEVGYLAKMARPGKVILTHLPHFGNREQLVDEVSQQYDGEIFLAKCGLNFEIV